jgi:threonine dehydratase
MTIAVAPPTPADARAAQAALAGLVRRTPVLEAVELDDLAGCQVLAKAECLQLTGSFKVRGALNRVRTLPPDALAAGLITVSAGNAALGVAHAARQLGAGLTVVMPEKAVAEKVAGARRLGATVVQDGVTDAAAAFARAAELQADRNLTFVHPFDDPQVVAGAATATLELLEDHPGVQRLFVPCSGGGLLAGAVLAAATVGSPVTIYGVQPDGADALAASLRAGVVTPAQRVVTVADGLTAPAPGALNFAMIRDAGVEVLTVSDEEILHAMRLVLDGFRVVIEPSAAAGVAGLLSLPRDDRPAAVLFSGSNVNRQLLAQVVG